MTNPSDYFNLPLACSRPIFDRELFIAQVYESLGLIAPSEPNDELLNIATDLIDITIPSTDFTAVKFFEVLKMYSSVRKVNANYKHSWQIMDRVYSHIVRRVLEQEFSCVSVHWDEMMWLLVINRHIRDQAEGIKDLKLVARLDLEASTLKHLIDGAKFGKFIAAHGFGKLRSPHAAREYILCHGGKNWFKSRL